MQVSDSIISYATIRRGPFKKKELAKYLRSSSDINDASLTTLLARLVATGRLIKAGWGEYALPQERDVFRGPQRIASPLSEAFMAG